MAYLVGNFVFGKPNIHRLVDNVVPGKYPKVVDCQGCAVAEAEQRVSVNVENVATSATVVVE